MFAEASDAPTAYRGRALTGLGLRLSRQARYQEAQRYLEESLSLRRSLADLAGIAEMVNGLAIIAGQQGDYGEAERRHEQALAA